MPERWRKPFASSDAIRRRMSTQRRTGTEPELALRRLLHGMGLRYRVHRSPLPAIRRRADMVFGPARVAVFVDGCFWHGCPDHGRREHKVNGWYWPEKIERNRRRDADTDRRLTDAGWLVLRIWEHEEPGQAAAGVADAVGLRRRRAKRRMSRPPSAPRSPADGG
ncbi:MAG: DNA mismatch endonuclease Vsr [Acidimicrobiales bacterium]